MVTYPDSGTVSFALDAAGRLTRKTDQAGDPTDLVYDAMGRALTRTKGSEIDVFEFDALGKITLVQRGVSGNLDSVAKAERFHNGLGRLTREAQAVKERTALNTDYVYDKVGNTTALYYPGGALTISRTVTPANLANVISRNGTQMADYDYVGGRVASLIYETGANDVTATRSYDGAARLTRLTWARSATTLPDFSYDFDAAGNILTRTQEHRASNKAEAFGIDGLYRLTDARYDYRVVTHGFTYDDLGNQLTYVANATTKTYLHNEVNEITKVEATQVYSDANGNLTKDDAGGNGPYSYFYDRQNQLTKVTNAGGDVAEYAYDALGRRVQFIDSANAVTKRFYYSSARVIDERDADAGRQRYYVWGNYVDELLWFNDDAGDNSDYVVCHDQLFSPAALVNTSGAVVERYDYDAYGQPIIYTGSGVDTTWFTSDDTTGGVSAKGLPYLFTGREFDDLDDGGLKLQYSRARYYNFDLRRWLQRDRLGYVDGASLYEYVRSMPTLLTDPTGKRSGAEWFLILTGGVKCNYMDCVGYCIGGINNNIGRKLAVAAGLSAAGTSATFPVAKVIAMIGSDKTKTTLFAKLVTKAGLTVKLGGAKNVRKIAYMLSKGGAYIAIAVGLIEAAIEVYCFADC